MATMNLSELEILNKHRTVPLSLTADKESRELFFDYDDDGNPKDFGFDIEPEDPKIEDFLEAKDKFVYDVSPSQFAELAIRIPEAGRINQFSFEGRRYLRRIYDSSAKRILLVCGRQVEKSIWIHSPILLADGRLIEARDVMIGDKLATLDNDGTTMTTGEVVWVSKKYSKPCVRIVTRQGHVVTAATTHPIRVWDGWLEAGELKVGDRIAAVRAAGTFVSTSLVPEHRIIFTAFLLSNGRIGDEYIGVISAPNSKFDEFMQIIKEHGISVQSLPTKEGLVRVKLVNDGELRRWLQEDGLWCVVPEEKFVPQWVFGLSREETARFLKWIWTGRGHVKQSGGRQYATYVSISRRLARDIQALLWKFGIPSRVRKGRLENYGKQKKEVDVYTLIVDDKAAVSRFLYEIQQCNTVTTGDNDAAEAIWGTYPNEIWELVRKVAASKKDVDHSLLLGSLPARATFRLLNTYLAFFKADPSYDQNLVRELERHVYGDICWDEIISITTMGEQECIDFEVDGTHNFVADGVVTHNSTTLGNKLLCYSALINNFRSLYVAPSAEQAKVFSIDRIKDVIDASPLLQAYVPNKGSVGQAVFFKKFVNFSQIRMRYAYLTADRVRGITADLLCFDMDTRVLTDKGWKPIWQLTPYDLVADVNDNGVVEWHRPLAVFNKPFTGNMVLFEGDGLRLRVTEDHNMWANADLAAPSWQFYKASQLTVMPWFQLTCGADWQERYVDKIQIGDSSDSELPAWSFSVLAAWFTARGYIWWQDSKHPNIIIDLPRERDVSDLLAALDTLKLQYTVQDDTCFGSRILISSSWLCQYFSELGDIPERRLPREILEYPSVLRAFLGHLYDAHSGSLERKEFTTISRKLAEDVQETWLRLRVPAVIEEIKDDEVTVYKINTNTLADNYVFDREHKTGRINIEQVKDEVVYCFTVPHHRPIVKGSFESAPVICGQCIDELQDILVDNIPIIEQCTFHSPPQYRLFMYSGTPKTEDNTIAHYWSEFSTQNEWIVPCERHGTPNDKSSWHWNILTEANIGPKGLICDRCHSPIDAAHPEAKWAAMNPVRESNREKVTFEGYRIPQIMVPWVDWGEILTAQEQYPRAQFMNEKLGLSYDSGARPITKAELQACCQPHIRLGDIEHFRRIVQGRAVYAGIDWGSGENTYTVISFGGYIGTGNFTIFYIHRFVGQDLDPQRQLDVISQMVSMLNARIIGVDYGGGFYQNDVLSRRFGPERVIKYQYNPRQKKKIYWEPSLRRYMCHRSEVMSDLFNALKRRMIDLPNWDDFCDPYGQDILNIFVEYNDRLRINEYKHSPGKTDDSFHSILYCLLASMIQHPRPDIIQQPKDTGVPAFIG